MADQQQEKKTQPSHSPNMQKRARDRSIMKIQKEALRQTRLKAREVAQQSEIPAPGGIGGAASSSQQNSPPASPPQSPLPEMDAKASQEAFFKSWEPIIRQCFPHGSEYKYICGLIVSVSHTVCSFCNGRGHLPHKCASKRNVDEAMRHSGNAALWGSIKHEYKQIQYKARRSVRRELDAAMIRNRGQSR